MPPRLFKAAEICDLAHVQPYVLRSWEKEFPGIGLQKSPDGVRVYRQSDLDQVLRIKHLVFVDGLTVAGARRKLEEESPVSATVAAAEAAEALDVLGSDARTRIATVRDGLKALHALLSSGPGEFALEPPPLKASRGAVPKLRAVAARERASTATQLASTRSESPKASAKRRNANA